MSERFLFENLINEFGKRTINQKEIDECIKNNLNKNFPLRYYQEEVFKIVQTYFEEEHQFKSKPISLLFHMATGSGKTLIMAGLMLYLYKKGFNNFIFFVDKTDILEKTKDNFLNKYSNKYQFEEKIQINDKIVELNSVNNFEGVNQNSINICFTTIQKLHNDLLSEKENSLTYDEFKNKKIVLISDESHHIQVKTKSGQQYLNDNWENTIERLQNSNSENILLEFTATPGYEDNSELRKKNLNRLIYRYDLKQFVQDKFSKNIDIFKIDENNLEYLMLVSIIVNQYRQDIANKYGINLKPVILFKAAKEIKDSNFNYNAFNKFIKYLSINDILDLKRHVKSNNILNKIFQFYSLENISEVELVKKLKISFNEKYCLNVNEKNIDKKSISNKDKLELIQQQNILNSLEDENNPIRVIFAVNKLNEGWDVLNLFDIVRIPSSLSNKSSKSNNNLKPKKTTISEAQLIGRGARYFPFEIDLNEDKYKRKFDDDYSNELKILEDLYYYSFNDSRYINELKLALKEEGLQLSEDYEHKPLLLKNEFKSSYFYNNGKIFINDKFSTDFSYITTFHDLNDDLKNFQYNINSKDFVISSGFNDNNFDEKVIKINKLIKLKDIETHIIKNALSKIDFFKFNNLKKYYNINSINDLIDDKFLYCLSIIFHGTEYDINNLSNQQIFNAVYTLFLKISEELQNSIVHYKGTFEFNQKNVKDIFYDKILEINKNDERCNGQEEIVKNLNWYVFNANYGTTEEKNCLNFISSIIHNLEKEFEDIYFIRNEKHFKIFNFSDGNSFEPDFVLFLKDKHNNNYYQLFIEPKGSHLIEHDIWKEKFLSQINDLCVISTIYNDENYYIYGLPFYNENNKNIFKENLFRLLNVE